VKRAHLEYAYLSRPNPEAERWFLEVVYSDEPPDDMTEIEALKRELVRSDERLFEIMLWPLPTQAESDARLRIYELPQLFLDDDI
jgi:hypothetical protein